MLLYILDNNYSKGREIILFGVQLEVAEDFWEYMKGTKKMPETKVELQQLYLDVYRSLLDCPLKQHVEFAPVLSCMKNLGFLKTKDEIIIYQVEQNPRSDVKEGHDAGTRLSSAACNNQELAPRNAEKTSRKVRKLKCPNGKEEGYLQNKRYS